MEKTKPRVIIGWRQVLGSRRRLVKPPAARKPLTPPAPVLV
jgi:hypothetical protein